MENKLKFGILGAGISGLTIAKLLSKDFDVQVLEKSNLPGGIARTKNSEGISYHVTGGHCFNSKHKDVLDFVFDEILPLSKWNKIDRNAAIKFRGHEITYPIEFALKQIHKFDSELAINIIKDFINALDSSDYKNLEDWFRKKFGDTLAETYFLPYNEKIWNRSPSQMSHLWVEGKLPIPDKESFIKSLIDSSEDKMPHSVFYYPSSNNQNDFIDALSGGLNIVYNYEVNHIRKNEINKFIINDFFEYDYIINTLPLNVLPSILNETPQCIIDHAAKLKYNKVSTVLWESKPTDRTWTYLPESNIFFHRYIHIGNFFSPKKNYTISEVVGEKSFEEMIAEGGKDDFLIRPIDYNVSNHAYVVFNEDFQKSKKEIMDYLDSISVFTLGRFGEWEYYNMDVCIKSAIDLQKKLFKKFNER